MIKKIGIYSIFAVIILLFSITACDSLIAPMEGRNNPYDENNPIKLPSEFSANLRDAAPNRVVELQLALPEASAAEGYIIIRKAGSEAETIWDGVISNMLDSSEDYIEDYENAEGEYPVGNKVYYSLFAYGPKWDDMSDDDKIQIPTDGSGYIKNAENYNFVGPLSSSVIVTDQMSFPVAKDGYVDSGGWNTVNSQLVIASDGAERTSVAFITFSLSNLQNIKIVGAELELTQDAANSESVQIAMMNTDWDGGTLTVLRDSGVINSGYNVENVAVSGAIGDIFNFDMKEFLLAWKNDEPNFGIRIIRNTLNLSTITFESSNNNNPPRLAVEYYYD